jgi:serine/threonine protein kinase/predicted negative regulator of RcsB-dependent stress response
VADGEGVAIPGNRQSGVTPERWKEVEAVFEQVLEVPVGERSAFIDRTCADDEELRREVKSLLESHGRAGTFLRDSDLFFCRESFAEDGSLLVPGQTIDRYRIIREIGRGGMGAVYLAARADAEYEKQVAIKLIKRGMDTDAVLRHFRNERQILATFDHPNIARLFDGGTTGDGLPYFVMEYVEGLPINEYSNKQALSINERLKLFCEVCAAVSYAHRHLVIHRDIKRRNILVTAEGIPKLLDFGIAKILQEGDGAQPPATMTGLRLMTPEYASPEQIRGEPVTTASDVYSLGVVLYELLTGSSPYRFTSRAPGDVERAITEQEPTRPSTAAPESNRKSAIANRRSLRGDLDNIILMALRKEPERRYQSVEQFSEDIRRHLELRPVLARKDTVRYRATKFIRRNKAIVAAAALVLLSLVSGMIATSWEARRARVEEAIAKAEKERAERRFADVRQLAHSLLFDYHDAIKDLPGATRVRERLVKDALANLDKLAAEAHGDSVLQRELAVAYERVGDVRGQAYSASLGDRAGAVASYQKALKIREALAAETSKEGEGSRELAGTYRKLGNELLDTSEAATGLKYLEKSLALFSKLAAEQPDDPQIQRDVAESHNAIGSALEDRNDMIGALEHHRHALTIREQLVAVNPTNRDYRRDLSVTYENIGRVLSLSNDVPGALENNHKAMALREALLAEDPVNADYRRILSISYQNNGDYRAFSRDTRGALESFRRKLAIDEQSFATDPANAQARLDLGYCCLRMGELLAQLDDHQAAAASYRRASEMYQQSMVVDPQDVIIGIRAAIVGSHLGEELARLQNISLARQECAKTVELLRITLDDPANVNQRRLRVLAFTGLGDAYVVLADAQKGSEAASNDRRAARDNYRRALDIMHEHRERGIADADDLAAMDEVARKATSCESMLRQ